MLKKKLLDILACPICKSNVQLDDSQEQLNCSACQIAFPVKNGFPVMLKEEAKPLKDSTEANHTS